MADIPLVSFHDLKEDTFIIDVRQPEEAALDVIHGASNIPLAELFLRSDEIPQDQPLALVCTANVRSAQGAYFLHDMGYENVCILDRYSF